MPSSFLSSPEESRERRATRLANAAEQRQIRANSDGTTNSLVEGFHATSPHMGSHVTSPHVSSCATSPHVSSYATSPHVSSHVTSPHTTSPHVGSHVTSPHANSHVTSPHASSHGAQSPASSVATSTVVSPDPNGCAICMNTISENDAYECHVCSKKYHRPCIQEWFCRSVICPLCRAQQTNVPPELLPTRRPGAPSAAAMGTLMAMLGMSNALETRSVFDDDEGPNGALDPTGPRRFHFVVRPPNSNGGGGRRGTRQRNPPPHSPLQSDSDEESFVSFLDNLDMTAMTICFLAVFMVVCVVLHVLDTSFFHLAAEFLKSVAVVFGVVLLSAMVVALVFCLCAVWTSMELTYVVGTWDGWVVGGMTVLAVLLCVGLAAKTFVDGSMDSSNASGMGEAVYPEPPDSVSSW